ncbi:hypothetical protein B0H11DRAFT_2243719 [Mycena galericulata]|nr:hypothetical protein B0H11DRAFT_2243719 [Mycena galericulata]
MTQLPSDQVAPAASSDAAEASASPMVADANEAAADGSSAPASPAPTGSAAAPAGSAVTPTARTGLQSTGPWIVGELYNVVPGGPLALVPDRGEKWYAITKGRFVGVTNNSAFADGAVSRVSNALRGHYDTQAEAATVFNDALASGLGIVAVV